ncbi:MAG: hypothetical protein ACD_69C00364G0001, partial [uncultured bacterium]
MMIQSTKHGGLAKRALKARYRHACEGCCLLVGASRRHCGASQPQS